MATFLFDDLVMIYSIARDTPDSTVKTVPKNELEKIAARAKDNGHKTQVN
ncbi:MAG: hypothetical protein U9Q98_05185 [Bacteroidota bacterium]|nr:hypothetical protein [Bacteroidota bacterium]